MNNDTRNSRFNRLDCVSVGGRFWLLLESRSITKPVILPYGLAGGVDGVFLGDFAIVYIDTIGWDDIVVFAVNGS